MNYSALKRQSFLLRRPCGKLFTSRLPFYVISTGVSFGDPHRTLTFYRLTDDCRGLCSEYLVRSYRSACADYIFLRYSVTHIVERWNRPCRERCRQFKNSLPHSHREGVAVPTLSFRRCCQSYVLSASGTKLARSFGQQSSVNLLSYYFLVKVCCTSVSASYFSIREVYHKKLTLSRSIFDGFLEAFSPPTRLELASRLAGKPSWYGHCHHAPCALSS